MTNVLYPHSRLIETSHLSQRLGPRRFVLDLTTPNKAIIARRATFFIRPAYGARKTAILKARFMRSGARHYRSPRTRPHSVAALASRLYTATSHSRGVQPFFMSPLGPFTGAFSGFSGCLSSARNRGFPAVFARSRCVGRCGGRRGSKRFLTHYSKSLLCYPKMG